MLCHPQRRGGGDIPANAEELVAAYGGNARDPPAKAPKLFKGVQDAQRRRGRGVNNTNSPHFWTSPLCSSVAGQRRRGTSASMEQSMNVLFIPISQNAK